MQAFEQLSCTYMWICVCINVQKWYACGHFDVALTNVIRIYKWKRMHALYYCKTLFLWVGEMEKGWHERNWTFFWSRIILPLSSFPPPLKQGFLLIVFNLKSILISYTCTLFCRKTIVYINFLLFFPSFPNKRCSLSNALYTSTFFTKFYLPNNVLVCHLFKSGSTLNFIYS